MSYMPEPLEPRVPTAPPTPFQISPEDQKIIQECNNEAFFRRCLPAAAGLGTLTVLAIRAGYLRPHPTWGVSPKVMGAAFLGYFLGKVSYQSICAEKLMSNPNSPLGAILRARKQKGQGGGFQDALTLDLPGYNFSAEDSSSPNVYRDDLGPRTFTDLDTDRPYNQGLDDSFRLNVDSPQRPEDFVLPPASTSPNTYEELRRRNREEYEMKLKGPRPGNEAPYPYQPMPPPRPYQPTNAYGDTFEK